MLFSHNHAVQMTGFLCCSSRYRVLCRFRIHISVVGMRREGVVCVTWVWVVWVVSHDTRVRSVSSYSTWRAFSTCNTLQHTATHCNTLQHTATHCNTLQHIISLVSSHPHVCKSLSPSLSLSICHSTLHSYRTYVWPTIEVSHNTSVITRVRCIYHTQGDVSVVSQDTSEIYVIIL